METTDLGAVLAWFLNTLGVALLTGMAVAAVLAVIGVGTDKDWLTALAFAAGPATTGGILATTKAPSERRLSETHGRH